VHPDLKIYIGENIYGPIELGVHFDLPVVHVFKDRQRVNVPRHPFFSNMVIGQVTNNNKKDVH
jgi:hypothetical protein